jgi:hypothetical protein
VAPWGRVVGVAGMLVVLAMVWLVIIELALVAAGK